MSKKKHRKSSTLDYYAIKLRSMVSGADVLTIYAILESVYEKGRADRNEDITNLVNDTLGSSVKYSDAMAIIKSKLTQ